MATGEKTRLAVTTETDTQAVTMDIYRKGKHRLAVAMDTRQVEKTVCCCRNREKRQIGCYHRYRQDANMETVRKGQTGCYLDTKTGCYRGNGQKDKTDIYCRNRQEKDRLTVTMDTDRKNSFQIPTVRKAVTIETGGIRQTGRCRRNTQEVRETGRYRRNDRQSHDSPGWSRKRPKRSRSQSPSSSSPTPASTPDWLSGEMTSLLKMNQQLF